MALEKGTRLDGYIIETLIGRGSTGEVYRARDTRLDRLVALKVVSSEVSSNAAHFARFDREARTCALLNHANILSVYDIGSYDGRPFIVSELLHGTSLRGWMAGPLSAAIAVDYARQIASGLIAAHDMDVIHRDLKPENIFVTLDGRVKILDFGMSKSPLRALEIVAATEWTDPGPRLSGMHFVTVGYVSPEQVLGKPADPRSDVFSLGVMLYEMVSGTLPFQGRRAAETLNSLLNDQPPPITTEPGLNPDLDRLIRRCIEKDPQDRFPSVRSLAYALELVDLTSRREPPSASARWPLQKVMWLA